LTRGQQELKQELQQELHSHSEAWLKSLQENFEEVKSAMVEIRTTQGTHNERFDHVTTKDDLAALKTEHGAKLDQILQFLQQKPSP
jgi:iron uptake system EfeUOB component EfeO/EfeM